MRLTPGSPAQPPRLGRICAVCLAPSPININAIHGPARRERNQGESSNHAETRARKKHLAMARLTRRSALCFC